MRPLTELLDIDDPAWPEIAAAITAAPYPVVVLDADPQRADAELLRAQVTTSRRPAAASRAGMIMARVAATG